MKKALIYFLVLIILILIFYAADYLVLRYSTIGARSTENLESLLVVESDFPGGWVFKYQMPITGDFNLGDENLMKAFSKSPELGFAYQYVYRFKNTLIAKRSYNYLREHLVLVESNLVDFSDYVSQAADRWFLACEVSIKKHIRCNYLLRYDNFIIFFGITADDNHLTPEQFDKIIRSIDNRVISRLDR